MVHVSMASAINSSELYAGIKTEIFGINAKPLFPIIIHIISNFKKKLEKVAL